MQNEVNPTDFKTKEDRLWGSTKEASTVRLSVNLTKKPTIKRIPWGGKDGKYLQFDNVQVPGFVLFPFQNKPFQPGDDCDLIGDLSFILKVTCLPEHKNEVCNGRIPIFPVMPPALDYACLPFVSSSSNALLYKMIVA